MEENGLPVAVFMIVLIMVIGVVSMSGKKISLGSLAKVSFDRVELVVNLSAGSRTKSKLSTF